jgi:hypothetical protein
MAKLRIEEYGGQVAEHRKMLEGLMCRNPACNSEASLAFLPDGWLVGMALNSASPLAFNSERLNGRIIVCLMIVCLLTSKLSGICLLRPRSETGS